MVENYDDDPCGAEEPQHIEEDPPEDECDHMCTSNCRREGCNCECGEFHQDNSPEKTDEEIEFNRKAVLGINPLKL